jgi:hypothetical protein
MHATPTPTLDPNPSATLPAPGQVVRCRTRTWLVESVEPSPHGAKVTLACLDDDGLADTLASAPDDIRERIELADYFFPDAATACRFQSHIKKDGEGKLPCRYRWPDDTRDDILASLLAFNAKRAEFERLTGFPGARAKGDAASGDTDSDSVAPSGGARPAKKAKKASKRASKKSAPRPFLEDE